MRLGEPIWRQLRGFLSHGMASQIARATDGLVSPGRDSWPRADCSVCAEIAILH
jgi:hypothetical protein